MWPKPRWVKKPVDGKPTSQDLADQRWGASSATRKFPEGLASEDNSGLPTIRPLTGQQRHCLATRWRDLLLPVAGGRRKAIWLARHVKEIVARPR